jgi:hypothetical protein
MAAHVIGAAAGAVVVYELYVFFSLCACTCV